MLLSDEAIVLSPMPFASLGRKCHNAHDCAAMIAISGTRDVQRWNTAFWKCTITVQEKTSSNRGGSLSGAFTIDATFQYRL